MPLVPRRCVARRCTALTSPHGRHAGPPPPPPASPPASRQPPRRGRSCRPAPLPSGAIGALGPVRSLSGGFGQCPFGSCRSGRRWGRAARGCGQRRCAARGSPGREGEHRPLGARPQGALGWAGPAALPGIPVSRRGTRSAGSGQALPTYRRSVFSLGVRVQRHLSRVCGRASSEPEKVKTVLKSADSGTQQSLKCRPS